MRNKKHESIGTVKILFDLDGLTVDDTELLQCITDKVLELDKKADITLTLNDRQLNLCDVMRYGSR